MTYSLLTYDFKDHFNVGDYVQSIAARQFLPRVDQYINREKLNEYDGPETKIIMNGWFMRHPNKWPPSPKIIPLLVSFHMNAKCQKDMLSQKGISFLKKYGPIGCRDLYTLNLMQECGIKAYFSSCLTLTLGNSYRHRPGKDILFVDVLFKYPTLKTVFKSFNRFRKSVKSGDILLLGKRKKILREIFGDKIIESASEITHHYPINSFPTEDSRFELAHNILKKYETAKLVVTSRIHCALPCIAMGTPVIFLEADFKNIHDKCRLEGITDLFKTIKISPKGHFTAYFDLDEMRKTGKIENKTCHLKYIENLNNRCKNFIDDQGNI